MTTEPSSVTGIKLGHSTILWIHVFGFSVFILLRLFYRTPARRRYYNPNNLRITPKKCFTIQTYKKTADILKRLVELVSFYLFLPSFLPISLFIYLSF